MGSISYNVDVGLDTVRGVAQQLTKLQASSAVVNKHYCNDQGLLMLLANTYSVNSADTYKYTYKKRQLLHD